MSDEVRFSGELVSARGGGHVVPVDEELAAAVGAKHGTRVRGTLNDAAFRSNLAKMGGVLYLGVHKTTIQAAGVETGETVEVRFSTDTERREADVVPPELRSALRRNRDAAAAWKKLPPSHRRQHVGHILEAKEEETRARRIERTISELARRDTNG
jgi:bacteriocin resistance YdeI/OmpD-like protein/uncharacterized protein DUF1905